MTGILDKEAKDLLGDSNMQEVFPMEDYMPVTTWEGQPKSETTHGG